MPPTTRASARHRAAWRQRIGAAVLTAVDVAVLIALLPKWGRLSRDLTAPHAWVAREGADRATATLASAALWLVALWLAIGLLGALAAGLPGPAGAIGRALATRVLPAVLVRTLAGTIGLSVLLTPIAAGASSLPAPTMPASTTSASTSATSAGSTSAGPGWPTSSATGTPRTNTVAVPQPSASAPTPATTTPTMAPAPAPTTSPPARPTQATPPALAPSTPPVGSGNPGQSVTVRPGDSLWLIAAHRLGPQATANQIETAWQHWYAANASSIGADPALIHPGNVLQAPSS